MGDVNSVGSVEDESAAQNVDLRDAPPQSSVQPDGIHGRSDSIRVLVVEDHPFMREGVCAHLRSQDRMQVLGGFPSIESVPLPLRAGGIDVVVLDLSLGEGRSGIDNLAAVVAWGAAVVVHTASSTEIVRDACLREGAKGFVGKDASIDELPRVVRAVAAGRYGEAGVEFLDLRAPLTEAGKRVLAHLTEVSGSDELARRLSHSSSYVDNLISTLMIKTDRHTRAELAAWAVRHGCHLLIGTGERV